MKFEENVSGLLLTGVVCWKTPTLQYGDAVHVLLAITEPELKLQEPSTLLPQGAIMKGC